MLARVERLVYPTALENFLDCVKVQTFIDVERNSKGSENGKTKEVGRDPKSWSLTVQFCQIASLYIFSSLVAWIYF